MSKDTTDLEQRVAELETQVATLHRAGYRQRTVRKRSDRRIFGAPLYDIACGPDPDRGEIIGHARGFIAIGDEALGVFALGGIARGVFAFGGLALGAVTFGGCSLGLLLAIGGAAVGGIAIGGAAVGGLAVGGAAIGYIAVGGGAFGKFVISAAHRSPEAIEFFRRVWETVGGLGG
jgi:hypothetical protein